MTLTMNQMTIYSDGLIAHMKFIWTWKVTQASSSIGQEGTYTSSCKQKLNTKSSTEAESVAIDDAMF